MKTSLAFKQLFFLNLKQQKVPEDCIKGCTFWLTVFMELQYVNTAEHAKYVSELRSGLNI